MVLVVWPTKVHGTTPQAIEFAPVLFLTLPVAVWLLDGSSSGRLGGVFTAAITGWWFGFGYFVAGLYWIGIAFLVDVPDDPSTLQA